MSIRQELGAIVDLEAGARVVPTGSAATRDSRTGPSETQCSQPEQGAVDDSLHREIETLIPRLTRYALVLTRDALTADDLVQDCLGRALAKIHHWQKGTDLRAWLFAILHNQHISRVRREARERASVEEQKCSPRWALPPPQIACLELREVERAFARLPQEQQSVILLIGVEEMGYEEAAAVLNVPIGTVRSRVSRGRESLRKMTGLFPSRHSRLPGIAATLDCSLGPVPVSATIG